MSSNESGPSVVGKRNTELENYVWEKSSSKFNYVAGYFSNSAIVAWLYYRAFHSPEPMSALQLLIWTIVGYCLWTFLEYWLHRVAYHVGNTPFVVGHELHHEKPKALLGVPYYLTAALYIPLSWGLSTVLPMGPTSTALGACWAGYIFYCAVHHSSHHWLLKNSLMKGLRGHHLQHHFHWDKNFGMVTSFWDKVFGTHL